MTEYILFSLIGWLAGARTQRLTYVSFLLALLIIIFDVWRVGALSCLVASLILTTCYIIMEWILGKLSSRCMAVSIFVRLLFLLISFFVLYDVGNEAMMPFFMAGLWFCNSPFGVVHGFKMSGAQHLAAMQYQDGQTPTFNVTEHGIMPDTGKDVLEQVQALIDKVGKQGGGCIFFPKGRYLFNLSGKKQFLTINYSHVTLEGECDADGHLMTELVNCGPTTQGERNPWLSPFFITTGESLQPSNMFWGLQFRKPSGMRTESSSLSDPGSDGAILTPPYATKVTSDSLAGTSMLSVEDSSLIGKYILLGMYNTTPDGNLIKELLGTDELRPEWTTARRAGTEEAPSFQWLVEVKQVIDKHTVELCRPLLRDCLMKYEPAIYDVEMLEDIHIRRLRISSRWNGLFRHHGFPLYYSVSQAQEMDYGWNAINMKRVAHATVEDVEIKDFTNPLYVQDSREVTVDHMTVRGYDGHQGIKVYCHTCDCLFQHVDFYCHYADMMGGEGNAYANVFRDICYHHPTIKPVDFDFHGFSEGPMAPPAYNVFEHVRGFRYIKGAGAVFMQPACGIGNVWRDVAFEGGKKDDCSPFYALSYRVKSGMEKYVTALGYTLVMMMKRKQHSIAFAKSVFKGKLVDIDYMSIPRDRHSMFFPQAYIENINGR